MMVDKKRSALKSCKRQCHEAYGCVDSDRLDQLPHDIQLLIMSSLTMKEATRICVLSHRWKYLFRYFPSLVFEANSSALVGIRHKPELLLQKRLGFTRWVNNVVDAHLGLTIDELRVIYYLDVDNESDIDKWLVFASTKQVKNLELDFTSNVCGRSLIDCYNWPLECRMSSLGLLSKLASLRSLCLKYVNINVNDVESILVTCTNLEELCIAQGSIYLTDIILPHFSLQLKHLELSCLPRLLCIDILAPKLVSFTYRGDTLKKLRVREASFVSKVTIGNSEMVANAYDTLSESFSQLEYLSWRFFGKVTPKVSKGISSMTNLLHLELHVEAQCNESLLGWANLIEASPILQKISIKLSRTYLKGYVAYERTVIERKVRPLMSLKTLEIVGFRGLPIDFEFASYVIGNSSMLKEVILILDAMPFVKMNSVEELRRTVPQDVTFKVLPFGHGDRNVPKYPLF